MLVPDHRDSSDEAPGPRLEERIYHDLLERIRRGAYPPGARLPAENELAAEFGVSRPVVRAGLARLRAAGLVVSRQGAGSFVRRETAEDEGGFRPLGSIDDIAGYFDFRRLLEGEAAAAAARRCTDADRRDLDRLLARIDADIGAGQATIDGDIAFHGCLARIAGNRFLAESAEMLQPHTLFVARFVRSLSRSGYADAKRAMQIEHRAVAEAVAQRDETAARAAMERHLRASQARIFRGVDRDED